MISRRHRGKPAPWPTRVWRVTTAARVFALAGVVGQSLGTGSLYEEWVGLVSFAVLAAMVATLEYEKADTVGRLIPMAEAILASLMASSSGGPQSIYVYLAVPPVVAGLRYGTISALNTTFAAMLVLAFATVTGAFHEVPVSHLNSTLPWLFAGLGMGLLASWLTRSIRELESNQVAVFDAHRILTRLRALSHDLPLGLDSQAVAERLLSEVYAPDDHMRVSLYLPTSSREPELFAQVGMTASDPVTERGVAHSCIENGDVIHTVRQLAAPIQVEHQTFGAVVFEPMPRTTLSDATIQSAIADYSLMLDTALLFEDVRTIATNEERTRLAREIHDGIAQDVASLGYLVDDIDATNQDRTLDASVQKLRQEISRVVRELRLSIFELRREVVESDEFSVILNDYVREVSRISGVSVHLAIQELDAWSTPDRRFEIVRIAQEAISNARKHAEARNIWVRLTKTEESLVLEIEDDGIGGASAKPGHYGMASMLERAQRLGGSFDITCGPDGGTLVTVEASAKERMER